MQKSLTLILIINAFSNLQAAEIPTPSPLDADPQTRISLIPEKLVIDGEWAEQLFTEEQQLMQAEGDRMLQAECALFADATHPAHNPFGAFGLTPASSSQRKRFDIHKSITMSWEDEQEYIRQVQSKRAERLAWLKSWGEQSRNVQPTAATSSSSALTRTPSVNSDLPFLDVLPQPSQSIDEKSIELFIAKLLPNYKERGIHATMHTLPELPKKRLMLFITAAMMLDKEQEAAVTEGMSEAGREEWLRMATISHRENAAIESVLTSFADITDIRAQTRACIDRACAAFDSFQMEYLNTPMQSPSDNVVPVKRPDLDLMSLACTENRSCQAPERTIFSPSPMDAYAKHHEFLLPESAMPVEPLVPHTKNDDIASVDVANMNAFLRSLSPKLATVDLDQLPVSDSKKTLMDRLSQAIILTQKFAQAEELRLKNSTIRIDKKEWKEWRRAVLREKQRCSQVAFFALVSAQYDNAVARRAEILDQIEAYKLSMMDLDQEGDCIDTQESPELRELLEAQIIIDNELHTAMQNLCSIATAQEQTTKRKKTRRELFKREISQPAREIQSAENDYFLSTFESIL